ncbi:LysR family transcriptional regulator [Novosphingobium sp. M1R2S20]|uniref:LysR family transcriptional regulator n=1 Tax=Novosphingobium rhizovicinum TaxID=3228928 RepID=A0ABV3RF18_9SPHN
MLELRRLRYLVVLAKRLSYSRAAEDLGLSQSALSRAIQSLERELDVRLFDRDRAGVMLTEQGRWIVEKAEALLISATDFEHQVGFVARGEEGRTRFGLPAVPAAVLLPALAPRLREMPEFAHEVIVAEPEHLWLQLAMGEIEFMVCAEWSSVWPIPASMPVKRESLGHFPVSLIVRQDHPLLREGSGRRDFPLLVSNKTEVSSQTAATVRARLAASMQFIGDLAAARSLVKETDAIWLTCSYVVAEDIVNGVLAQLPLPEELEERATEVFRYSLVRRTLSPTVVEIEGAFRKRIEEVAQAVPSPQP